MVDVIVYKPSPYGLHFSLSFWFIILSLYDQYSWLLIKGPEGFFFIVSYREGWKLPGRSFFGIVIYFSQKPTFKSIAFYIFGDTMFWGLQQFFLSDQNFDLRLCGVVVHSLLPVQEVPSSNPGLTTSATHLPV